MCYNKSRIMYHILVFVIYDDGNSVIQLYFKSQYIHDSQCIYSCNILYIETDILSEDSTSYHYLDSKCLHRAKH